MSHTNNIDTVVSSSSSSNDTAVHAAATTAGSSSTTVLERYSDLILGVAFLVTALLAAKRMSYSRRQQTSGSGSAETAVVTAFYSLILLTSSLRAAWFFVPASMWQPLSYTPIAVYAWDADNSWIGSALSELVVTAGSLTLFSIFVLILVYWADILKKYFHPGSRRSHPMTTFYALILTLVALEVVNLICFLAKVYTTEGMILYNALLLATVSIVCVCEITIFSHRFRTVLKTLGAINQVSTDSQVRRIVWITVTGNLFFITRALLECVFAGLLAVYWKQHGTVDKVFTHKWWDTYTFIKYWSEVTILGLMLYILQSRFSAQAQAAVGGTGGGAYTKVPDAGPNVQV
jgi:hypothetical protein